MMAADTVFGVGCSFTRANTAVPIPPGKTIIHCTNDHEDINKDIKTQYPLVGDAKLVLSQLLEELKRQSNPQGREVDHELQEDIKATKEKWLEQWMPKLTSNEVTLNP